MFNNPIASGSGGLVLPSIHSPDYTTSSGVTGWSINRDGTATFNTLGGSVQITNQGIFFYVPTPASGNLVASFTDTGGTDPYGNQYIGGFFLNQHQAHITGDNSDTVIINPDGALGPEIQFAEAGSPFATHLMQFSNELRAEAVNASGALFRINMPVLATGGYQGMNTGQAVQPPFNVLAAFVEYLAASWAPCTILCPPSETIAIVTTILGRNNTTAISRLNISPKVKQGATVLVNPAAGINGVTITPEGAAAGSVEDHQGTCTYIVGQDVLAGYSGQTLTIIPCWRINAGVGPGVPLQVTSGSMSAIPQLYTQFQSG